MRVIVIMSLVIFCLRFASASPVAPKIQPVCPSGEQVEVILSQVLTSNNSLIKRSLHLPSSVKGGYVGKFDLELNPEKQGFDCTYYRKADPTNPILKFIIPPRR